MSETIYDSSFDIKGESTDDSGVSVSINHDGTRIAIGEIGFNSYTGRAQIYDSFALPATSGWDLQANITYTESDVDLIGNYGEKVSMNSIGNVVAISSPNYSNSTGLVDIHEYNGTSWDKRGDSIIGISNVTFSLFGVDTELNNDGTRVIIGSANSNNVTVYEWNSPNWDLVGDVLEGSAPLMKFGTSVSMNETGNCIAISEPSFNNGNGTVYTYTENTTVIPSTWEQKGNQIISSNTIFNSGLGRTLHMSNDGNRIITSSWIHDSLKGIVEVYSYDSMSETWSLTGSPFIGSNSTDRFGFDTDISKDSTTIAFTKGFQESKTVVVYTWSGSDWVQKGNDITTGIDEDFGRSISLDSTGNTIVIGAPHSNTISGTIRIFLFDSVNNRWTQVIPTRLTGLQSSPSLITNQSLAYVDRLPVLQTFSSTLLSSLRSPTQITNQVPPLNFAATQLKPRMKVDTNGTVQPL